jgi:hypothetical protein
MSKINPKLEEFVVSQLKKGRDIQLIKTRLQGAGWEDAEIEEAIVVLSPTVPKPEPKVPGKPEPKPDPKNYEPTNPNFEKDDVKKKRTRIASEDVIIVREDGKSHMAVEKYEVTEVSEKIIPEVKTDRLKQINEQIIQKANLEVETHTFLYRMFNLSQKQRIRITQAFFMITLVALLLLNGIQIYMFQFFEYGAR